MGNLTKLVQIRYNYGYVPLKTNPIRGKNQKISKKDTLWKKYVLS